jgi:hypothetical protein
VINNGFVELAATGSASGVSDVTLNSGGTLLLTAANTIKNTAEMKFAGGTMTLGTDSIIQETMGQLTLSSSSVLNLCATAGQVLGKFRAEPSRANYSDAFHGFSPSHCQPTTISSSG